MNMDHSRRVRADARSNSWRCLPMCLVMLALSGCLGGLSKIGAHRVYSMPEPQALDIDATAALSQALLVELPRSLPNIDSTDIHVQMPDGELKVLPDARWSARLPVLLQDLLVRQISQARLAPNVAADPQAYAQPLRLSSDLRSFGLRQSEDGGLRAHVGLTLRLVCNRSARVLASKQFELSSDTTVRTAQAVQSLRALASTLATQVVQWLASNTERQCV